MGHKLIHAKGKPLPPNEELPGPSTGEFGHILRFLLSENIGRNSVTVFGRRDASLTSFTKPGIEMKSSTQSEQTRRNSKMIRAKVPASVLSLTFGSRVVGRCREPATSAA